MTNTVLSYEDRTRLHNILREELRRLRANPPVWFDVEEQLSSLDAIADEMQRYPGYRELIRRFMFAPVDIHPSLFENLIDTLILFRGSPGIMSRGRFGTALMRYMVMNQRPGCGPAAPRFEPDPSHGPYDSIYENLTYDPPSSPEDD